MSKVVITYGTFDLFHYGHRALLEHAKELGDYLIVGVTSDAFDKARGKFDVKQPLIDRIHAVEATGLADKIIIEEFKGQKIDDIRKYQVDVFTVGSDWEGKFDYLKDYCDVVYLPRTVGVSSTDLRKKQMNIWRLGCVGFDDFTKRIIRESGFVSEVAITAVCDNDGKAIVPIEPSDGYATASSFDELANQVDAVYLSYSVLEKSQLVEEAISRDLHVLSEGPIAKDVETARRLQQLAQERNLVLMEASSVLFQPGFARLKLLLESGVIGEIKDVDAAYSLVPDAFKYDEHFDNAFRRMLSRGLLPALALLGTSFCHSSMVCGYQQDSCTWAKCDLVYETAAATLRVGRGVKTEGDMTITGTDGYVYVPAPWWKLEYFEIRNEDLRNIKKHYHECLGEGQRYLLRAFFGYCSSENRARIDIPELNDIELAAIDLIGLMEGDSCYRIANHSDRFGGGENVIVNS